MLTDLTFTVSPQEAGTRLDAALLLLDDQALEVVGVEDPLADRRKPRFASKLFYGFHQITV